MTWDHRVILHYSIIVLCGIIWIHIKSVSTRNIPSTLVLRPVTENDLGRLVMKIGNMLNMWLQLLWVHREFLLKPTKTRWWQLKHFLCSPRTLGKWSNLTNIFWNGLKPSTSFVEANQKSLNFSDPWNDFSTSFSIRFVKNESNDCRKIDPNGCFQQ